MLKKKMIFIFAILLICISYFFLFRPERISLEEIKKKLLLTQKIEVEKDPIVTLEELTYPTIEDEETIKEIITLLSNTYLPSNEWSNGWSIGAEHDIYYLKLFDKRNELIATVQIDSLPWEIKGKGYHYKLDSDSDNVKALKKILEREYDIHIP